MKKQQFFSGSIGILLATFLISSILFTSCKKDKPVHLPAAGLMVYNLAPDQDALGIAVDGNSLFNVPLSYLNYSGQYLSLYTGNRTFQSFVFGSQNILATTNARLTDSAYYSLFVVGTNGAYQNIFVEDKIDSLPTNTDNAFVRYINAVTGAQQHEVKINDGTNTIFDEASALGHVSSFKEVTPGNINIEVGSEGITDTTRIISLAKNGIYTVLISGMPDAVDTSAAIKIRFIQNGSIISK